MVNGFSLRSSAMSTTTVAAAAMPTTFAGNQTGGFFTAYLRCISQKCGSERGVMNVSDFFKLSFWKGQNMAKKVEAKKAEKAALTVGVHVSASLERNRAACDALSAASGHNYGYVLRKLYIDEKGNLIGHAGCSPCVIAAPGEFAALADFLSQVSKATAAK
jgi:hypothetical protein